MGAVVLSLLSIFLLTISCALEPDVIQRDSYSKPWVILVYMIADNNLDTFAVDDINEMERLAYGAPSQLGRDKDMDVVVYIDRVIGSTPETPVVLWITNDDSADIISPVVKTYDELNSSDPSTLKEFIAWAKTAFPADNYGLILWSHGSGWIPADRSDAQSVEKRFILINSKDVEALHATSPYSFGQDVSAGHDEMDIAELAGAINNDAFRFIAFDACYMGDVEVAYLLRNKAEYLMFSQIEILNDGYPYGRFFNAFLSNITTPLDKALELSAIEFYNYYANAEYAYKRSASISIVDLSGIEPLAGALSNFIASAITNGASNLINIASNVQRVSLVGEYSNVKFDLKDWIASATVFSNFASNEEADGLYSNFNTAFDNAVIFSTNTPNFMDSLALDSLHGLNIYIPFGADGTNGWTNNAIMEYYTNDTLSNGLPNALGDWSVISGMKLLLHE